MNTDDLLQHPDNGEEDDTTLATAAFDFPRARQGAVVPSVPGTTRVTIEVETGLLAWIDTWISRQGGGTLSAFLDDVVRQFKAAKMARQYKQ